MFSNKQRETYFMQKKLLAIAVAGALAPAAAMAQSTVEIYGRASLGVDQWSADGAAAGQANFDSRLRVFDNSSRLGFRINESLGGGMRVFVVIESGANIDSGGSSGQSGGANTSTGTFASRDSYLGIGGGWGDIRLGRQSIYYSNGIIAQAGANYINQSVDNIFSFAHAIGGPAGRESNVVSYNSPTMGGFNATVAWSPGASEGSGFTTGGAVVTAGTLEKESLWTLTGRYSGGPLRVQGDYGKRSNLGNINGVDRTGWKIGAGWAYAPGSQVSFMTGNHKNETLTTTLEQQLNFVNWEHMMGQWQFIAQYMFTGDIETNTGDLPNSQAKGWTLAAKYFLSKRTGVYVSYSQIDNEAGSRIDMNNAGYSSAAAIGLGADPQILAVGILHNF
jgi:predicted porin